MVSLGNGVAETDGTESRPHCPALNWPTTAYGRYHHLRDVARQPVGTPRTRDSCSVTGWEEDLQVPHARHYPTYAACAKRREFGAEEVGVSTLS